MTRPGPPPTFCPLSLPAPREFLWRYVGSTPLAGLVSGADASARDAFEADALGAWAPSSRGDGMEPDQPMVYARAFK